MSAPLETKSIATMNHDYGEVPDRGMDRAMDTRGDTRLGAGYGTRSSGIDLGGDEGPVLDDLAEFAPANTGAGNDTGGDTRQTSKTDLLQNVHGIRKDEVGLRPDGTRDIVTDKNDYIVRVQGKPYSDQTVDKTGLHGDGKNTEGDTVRLTKNEVKVNGKPVPHIFENDKTKVTVMRNSMRYPGGEMPSMHTQSDYDSSRASSPTDKALAAAKRNENDAENGNSVDISNSGERNDLTTKSGQGELLTRNTNELSTQQHAKELQTASNPGELSTQQHAKELGTTSNPGELSTQQHAKELGTASNPGELSTQQHAKELGTASNPGELSTQQHAKELGTASNPGELSTQQHAKELGTASNPGELSTQQHADELNAPGKITVYQPSEVLSHVRGSTEAGHDKASVKSRSNESMEGQSLESPGRATELAGSQTTRAHEGILVADSIHRTNTDNVALQDQSSNETTKDRMSEVSTSIEANDDPSQELTGIAEERDVKSERYTGGSNAILLDKETSGSSDSDLPEGRQGESPDSTTELVDKQTDKTPEGILVADRHFVPKHDEIDSEVQNGSEMRDGTDDKKIKDGFTVGDQDIQTQSDSQTSQDWDGLEQSQDRTSSWGADSDSQEGRPQESNEATTDLDEGISRRHTGGYEPFDLRTLKDYQPPEKQSGEGNDEVVTKPPEDPLKNTIILFPDGSETIKRSAPSDVSNDKQPDLSTTEAAEPSGFNMDSQPDTSGDSIGNDSGFDDAYTKASEPSDFDMDLQPDTSADRIDYDSGFDDAYTKASESSDLDFDSQPDTSADSFSNDSLPDASDDTGGKQDKDLVTV